MSFLTKNPRKITGAKTLLKGSDIDEVLFFEASNMEQSPENALFRMITLLCTIESLRGNQKVMTSSCNNWERIRLDTPCSGYTQLVPLYAVLLGSPWLFQRIDTRFGVYIHISKHVHLKINLSQKKTQTKDLA